MPTSHSRILTKKLRSLSSDIFSVSQAHTTNSKRQGFNAIVCQTSKDPLESEGDKQPRDQSKDKRRLPLLKRRLRVRTLKGVTNKLGDVLLTLGCLSILRQEEHGFLDRQKSQCEETPCNGRKRDTYASWFAK